MSGESLKQTPKLAVVMPAYNAAEFLPRTLPPLIAANPDGGVWVVDPDSTDATAEIAKGLGAQVISLPSREGPAIARNKGVDAVTAEVVLFVDSDCLAPEDLPRRVAAAFEVYPNMVALTGSYDSSPDHQGCVSLYMNLRHHYTHQHATQINATFWAGMGAVRRKAFQEVGGFDGERYKRPMIEDIELGGRIGQLGETRLDPSLQVKHLKHWTLANMIQTDIFSRAIPWTRLIQESGQVPNDLNLKWSARFAALVAPLALAGVACLALTPFIGTLALIGLLPIVMSIGASWGLLSVLARTSGPIVACAGWALHQLHLSYSATCFVLFSVIKRRETQS